MKNKLKHITKPQTTEPSKQFGFEAIVIFFFGGNVKKEIREQVYNKCGGHCAYCGQEISYMAMQVDHIKPKFHSWSDSKIKSYNNLIDFIKGEGRDVKKYLSITNYYDKIERGTDDVENLLPACRNCNLLKWILPLEPFRKILFGNTTIPAIFYFEKLSQKQL